MKSPSPKHSLVSVSQAFTQTENLPPKNMMILVAHTSSQTVPLSPTEMPVNGGQVSMFPTATMRLARPLYVFAGEIIGQESTTSHSTSGEGPA